MNTGYGKPANSWERYWHAFWSLQAKRPALSDVSAAAWVGLRYGDMPGPDNRTTAERLADKRYNPFREEN